MLFEYAVEPQAIGSSWENFRYLIEKFGFDRGRLISQFPKAWLREVYEASHSFKPMERKRLEEVLSRAKQTKIIRSGRTYDSNLGSWLQNAVTQHALTPFHAIIASQNPKNITDVIVAEDASDDHPLMISGHTWEVERVGTTLAQAMSPLIKSARTLLFVDRFFDISKPRYVETLKACLDLFNGSGGTKGHCEIHFCDHDKRPPPHMLEQNAGKWLSGIIPKDMSIDLFSWQEKPGGADFHARYLLTDIGGINVEAGFSAEGGHQKVLLSLLNVDLCQSKLLEYSQLSKIYDLVGPVLRVDADGGVKRC